MTGRELIQWIKDHNAEDKEVYRLTDFGCAAETEVKNVHFSDGEYSEKGSIVID